VLTLEKTCSYGDAVWRLSREEIFRRAEEDLKKLRFLDLGKIQTFDVIRINDAYPIYDLDFDKRLMVVYDFLSSINNLYSIGRQGLFLQGDLYESMEMGRMVVEDFIIRESYSRDWYDFIAANQGIAE
jgi:protoporphyrinogen oxidase